MMNARFSNTCLLIAAAAVFMTGCADPQPITYEMTRVGIPPARKEIKPVENTTVIIETSMGTITAELWADKAPITVQNFLGYTDDGFYNGLIFHRVIPGFMIQGGGFDFAMHQKPTKATISNEARTDTPNSRGTLAMARTPAVDSASSQFFINLNDNAALNHRDKSEQGFGYCVFGKVTDGMDVVDKIAKVKTSNKGPHGDVPVEAVTIKSVTRKAK